MNFAKQQRDPRRHLVGFGAVVLFHALIVYALVTGLAKKVVDVVRAPIETKVIEEIKKPPPPPEIVVPPPPKLEAPPPPYIPPPEVQIAVPPPVQPIVTLAPSPTPPPEPTVIVPVAPPVQAPVAVAPPPPAPPAPPPPKLAAQTVGSLCTKLPKPEVPSTDASVKADISVLLTIQGGKVTKMTVLKETYSPGSIDRKLKRAIVNSIQAAVDQYECPGDHADIPTSFGFTIN